MLDTATQRVDTQFGDEETVRPAPGWRSAPAPPPPPHRVLLPPEGLASTWVGGSTCVGLSLSYQHTA